WRTATMQTIAATATRTWRLAVAPATRSAAAAPASEPTLEMRAIAQASAQTTAPQSAARGASASVTPRPVATPLPPRKRSQTGKQWPTTAATPQAAPSEDESADFERSEERRVGKEWRRGGGWWMVENGR